MRTLQLLIMAAVLSATAARAGVISGPILNLTDIDYSTSGVGFIALVNTTLTSFTFQNQGQADTVVLVDPLGDILDSVAIPAGPTVTVGNYEYNSDAVVVDWSLTAGDQYYLLQTTFDNSHFNEWLAAAPSDSEIAMTDTGDFTFEGTPDPLDSADFTFGGGGVTALNTGLRSITSPPAVGVLLPNLPRWFWFCPPQLYFRCGQGEKDSSAFRAVPPEWPHRARSVPPLACWRPKRGQPCPAPAGPPVACFSDSTDPGRF